MSPATTARPTRVTPGDLHATVVLVRRGTEVASWPFAGEGRLDLCAVDTLTRLQLAARRLGCSIRLRDTCAELAALLDLAGLTDVLPAEPRSRRLEVGGEPEDGEQVGVEEVVVPDDPVA